MRGHIADLLGRSRVLVTATVVIGLSSLVGGFAGSAEILIGARPAQGAGAALMLPAALSILPTTFDEGSERHTALGVWAGVGGLASALGAAIATSSSLHLLAANSLVPEALGGAVQSATCTAGELAGGRRGPPR